MGKWVGRWMGGGGGGGGGDVKQVSREGMDGFRVVMVSI